MYVFLNNKDQVTMETITNKGNFERQICVHECLSLVFNSFLGSKLNAGVTLVFQAPEYNWETNCMFSYSFE